MHVNHVGIERPNAVASGQSASIAKTSISHVSMRMGSGIGQESKTRHQSTMLELMVLVLRQLGSLAGRVYEYERILKDLSTRAGLQDQDLIRKTLDRVGLG